MPWVKGAAKGGWRGSSPPLSNQNIDVYFLSFSPTLYCKSRSGALQNVLWQYHRRSNTFVIIPSGYEFSRFEKYWSSFLHSCVFCATIYNKSWVLPCSASVETSMTFEVPTVPIDVYFMRHKAGTFLMYTRGWYASVLPLLMFWEKFLMPDVLAAYLMLTELLFLSPNFISFQDEDS